MQRQLLTVLPAKAQKLLERIEAFAGTSVALKHDPEPPSPTDPNPDALHLSVTEQKATIYYRSADDVSAEGLIHELLHVHRYWNEGVPQIIPVEDSSGQRYQVTSQIENSLEHLIIVPREERFNIQPYEYWNRTAQANWGRYPWPNMTSDWARRKNCLLGWLSVQHLVTNKTVKRLAKSSVQKEGLLREAKRFDNAIAKALPSKPDMLSATVHFLRIPRDEARLLYLDVRNGRQLQAHIPTYE